MRRPILQSRFNPTPILIESFDNPLPILFQSRIDIPIPVHTIQRQSCKIGGTKKNSDCIQSDLQSSDNPAPIQSRCTGGTGVHKVHRGVQYCFN